METVTLNVGGKLFQTTQQTILKSKYFERIINFKKLENKVDEIIFVDDDPELFNHLLNYMRSPNYIFPAHHKVNLDRMMTTYQISRDIFSLFANNNIYGKAKFYLDSETAHKIPLNSTIFIYLLMN